MFGTSLWFENIVSYVSIANRITFKVVQDEIELPRLSLPELTDWIRESKCRAMESACFRGEGTRDGPMHGDAPRSLGRVRDGLPDAGR